MASLVSHIQLMNSLYSTLLISEYLPFVSASARSSPMLTLVEDPLMVLKDPPSSLISCIVVSVRSPVSMVLSNGVMDDVVLQRVDKIRNNHIV